MLLRRFNAAQRVSARDAEIAGVKPVVVEVAMLFILAYYFGPTWRFLQMTNVPIPKGVLCIIAYQNETPQ
jgi:hypothetical protein